MMKNKILWNVIIVFLIAAICFTIASFLTDYALPMRIAQIVCNSIVLILLVVWIVCGIRKDDKAQKEQREQIEQLRKQINAIEVFKDNQIISESKPKKGKKKSQE